MLTKEQDKFLEEIITLMGDRIRPKFTAGAEEHKNNIWELSDEQLEEEELFEILDLLVYRATRILKRRMK